MTTEKSPRIVTATIRSKAEESWHTTDGEAHKGFSLSLDIPEFGSKYPTICTRVPPELAAQLKLEQTYRLRLVQQSLKKNKDGHFPSHYYWGLLGIASEAERPKPIIGPVSVLPLAGNGHTDSRAAGVAMRFAVDLVVADKVELGKLEAVAQRIYRAMETLHTGAIAQTTEAIPNSPTEPVSRTPKAATPNSEPKDSPFPEASSAIAPTKSKEADITPTEFWTQWRGAGWPTGPDLPAMIERITKDRGNASTIDQAHKAGWSYRELLAAAKKGEA